MKNSTPTTMAIEMKEKSLIKTSIAIDKKHTRYAASSKRRACLFRKADELAVLCEADVAVIVISAEGIVDGFANSSVPEILTRFKECYNPRNRASVPEKDVSAQNMENNTFRKVLGKDLESMDLHEMFVLEEKLNKGLMCIKDRKIQMLTEELDQSRTHGQQVSQTNKILDEQIEELETCSEREGCDARPANRDHLPSTSFDFGCVPSTSYAADKHYCETTLSLAPPCAIRSRDIASSS